MFLAFFKLKLRIITSFTECVFIIFLPGVAEMQKGSSTVSRRKFKNAKIEIKLRPFQGPSLNMPI